MAASLFKWLFAGICMLAGPGMLTDSGVLTLPGVLTGPGMGRPGGLADRHRGPEGVVSGEYRREERGKDAHPLYIGVVEINHNAKDKTLEISCKAFTTDLEAVLEKQAHGKVDLSDPGTKKNADKLIAEYVPKHLQLWVDGKPVSLQYAGYEKEADGTWSYFVAGGVASVKKLDIVNSLLYDGFEQQINIMHISVGGVKKSSRLNYPDTKVSFEF